MRIPGIIMTNEMRFRGSLLIWTLVAICPHLTRASAEPASNATINATPAYEEPDGTPPPTHPFTHAPNTVPLPGRGGQLDPLPTASGPEAGYPPNESPSPATWDESTAGKGFTSKTPPPTTDGDGDPLSSARPPPAEASAEDGYPSSLNKSDARAVGREAQPGPPLGGKHTFTGPKTLPFVSV